MGNRKAAEAIILKWIKELDPTGHNLKITEENLKAMSDLDFDRYMQAIESGQDFVSMNYENLKKSGITVENNLVVAEKMGHEFFERLWLTDPITQRLYLTPMRYLVIDLPVRRQVEMLAKKISIPEDNRHIDEMTDQVVGVSKGSSLTYPEMLILYAKGLDSSIVEFMKFRGGDTVAYQEMERSIRETGGVNLNMIPAGKVKATQTLSILLKGAHLDNNY